MTSAKQRRDDDEKRRRDEMSMSAMADDRQRTADEKRKRDREALDAQPTAREQEEQQKRDRDVLDKTADWFERAATRAATRKLSKMIGDPVISTLLDAATETVKKRAGEEIEKKFTAPIRGLMGPA